MTNEITYHKKSNLPLFLILFGILGTLFAIFFFMNYEKKAKVVNIGWQNEAGENEYYIATQFLKKSLGITFEYYKESNEISIPNSPENTLVFNLDTLSTLPETGEKLKQWVESGGRLVFTTNLDLVRFGKPNDTVRETEQQELDNNDPNSPNVNLLDLFNITAVELQNPCSTLDQNNNFDQLHYTKEELELTGKTTKQLQDICRQQMNETQSRNDYKTLVLKDSAYRMTELYTHTHYIFKTPYPTLNRGLINSYSDSLLELQVGKGTVVVLKNMDFEHLFINGKYAPPTVQQLLKIKETHESTNSKSQKNNPNAHFPEIIENKATSPEEIPEIDAYMYQGIQQFDHASLLKYLVTNPNGTTTAHLYESYEFISWISLLVKYKPQVLITSALFLLIFLWRSMARFGSIYTPPELAERQLMKHIKQAGLFYWQNGSIDLLINAERQPIWHKIEQVIPKSRLHSEQDICQKLSEKSSIGIEPLYQALYERPNSPESFTQAIQTLQTLRKKL